MGAAAELPLLLSMACSGLGPAIATIVSNPLEVCKTRLQFSIEGGRARRYTGPIDCFRKTWQAEGVAGLQAGLGPAVVREGTKTFFRYGLFSPILGQLHDGPATAAPIGTRMAAGATAGAIAAVVCNPLDLLKCQLQASGGGGVRGYEYNSAAGAIRYIVRSSPLGVRALWVGTTVSIPRSMMSTSVMMTSQSWLKEAALDRQVRQSVSPSRQSVSQSIARSI
jgi:solute carrier family 25 protein 34/35